MLDDTVYCIGMGDEGNYRTEGGKQTSRHGTDMQWAGVLADWLECLWQQPGL